MLEIILNIFVSAITALVTTRKVAIKYMDVIDGYARKRMDEIKELVSNATRNK